MDAEQQREALARLESDYFRGALAAEEYARLKGQLLGDDAMSTVPVVPVQTAVISAPAPVDVDPVTGIRLASWGRRAGAWFIDWLVIIAIIWGVVFALVFAAEDEFTVGFILVVFLAPPIYQWLMIGRWGQTLGKMAVGIKVVRSEDASRVSYARALGRAASIALLGLFTLPLLVAYLWPLWDKRNQTVYDKMANTLVAKLG